ncbi:MAG: glutathione S-transferase family protein, partial [Rhizobiales bacterium]|nr:glutathione S-transferase family protein [Hyphomicrobiales bacterium]
MGLLVEGEWKDQWYDTRSTGGRFERPASRFRNWITRDGSAGPSGEGGFAPAAGRYHLYVAHACPWAHRTMIFRRLKGLERLIDVSVVSPIMLGEGWTFRRDEGSTGDPVNGAERMWEVYVAADPRYTGRVSVPVLWDKERRTIVNNESSEIIRMFNTAFDGLTGNTLDFYPEPLRAEIDAVNDRVYAAVNNGVYRTGFATTQEAYEEAFLKLFDALDAMEERLGRQRYLVGGRLTEADWRLFTTLVRFDAVYVGHFKCNL